MNLEAPAFWRRLMVEFIGMDREVRFRAPFDLVGGAVEGTECNSFQFLSEGQA